jgi:hypothetical protein
MIPYDVCVVVVDDDDDDDIIDDASIDGMPPLFETHTCTGLTIGDDVGVADDVDVDGVGNALHPV